MGEGGGMGFIQYSFPMVITTCQMLLVEGGEGDYSLLIYTESEGGERGGYLEMEFTAGCFNSNAASQTSTVSGIPQKSATLSADGIFTRSLSADGIFTRSLSADGIFTRSLGKILQVLASVRCS
jgi:hypothetical protein